MKNWIELCSDVNWEDYHGMWAKKNKSGVWFVLVWTNIYDAVGENYCKRDNIPQYECQVKQINLAELSEKELTSALDSCGYKEINGEVYRDFDGEVIDERYAEFAKLEACIGYGLGYLLVSFVGDKYPLRIRANARRYAENMMK